MVRIRDRIADFFNVNRIVADKFKEEEDKKKQELQEGMINCNSIAYRILYTEKQKSRDLVLKILSYCPSFSLTDVFIKQADVLSSLMNPSGMMI